MIFHAGAMESSALESSLSHDKKENDSEEDAIPTK